MKLQKQTRFAMLLAISVVCSILESFLPFLNGMIPGLKLGLANFVVLVVLELYGWKEAFSLSFLRIILVALLRTGLFNVTFFFSLFGAVLSILFMIVASKTKLFSIIGVSILGSIGHSVGQMLAAIFFLGTNMLTYLPILIFFSIVTGIFIGILSQKFLEYSSSILKEQQNML